MRKLLPLLLAAVCLAAASLAVVAATGKTPAGALYANIETSLGTIVVRLYEKEAPNTVASFAGLARGTKPFRDPKTGRMVRRRFYEGTTFHRVIPGFMVQAGDPLSHYAKAGAGEQGYQFENPPSFEVVPSFECEISPSLHFGQPGRLAMANKGAGTPTNNSQFFITVGPASHLEGGYTIFGQVVKGQKVADRISQVPRDERTILRDARGLRRNPTQDRPLKPVVIKRIIVYRAAKPR